MPFCLWYVFGPHQKRVFFGRFLGSKNGHFLMYFRVWKWSFFCVYFDDFFVIFNKFFYLFNYFYYFVYFWTSKKGSFLVVFWGLKMVIFWSFFWWFFRYLLIIFFCFLNIFNLGPLGPVFGRFLGLFQKPRKWPLFTLLGSI